MGLYITVGENLCDRQDTDLLLFFMVRALSSFGGGMCTGFQGMGLQYAGAGYEFPSGRPKMFRK